MICRLLLACCLCLPLAAAGQRTASPAAKEVSAARELTLTLDPAATHIEWILGGNTHTTHGTFKLKSGTVRFNPATGVASGLITVDATSGESGNSARDGRMHKEVIESASYPTVTFKPARVSGHFDPAIASTVMVDGTLNVHGQDHSMQLAITTQPQGVDLQAKTKFDIPYVQWGMKDPSNFLFRTAKTVQIEIDGPVRIQ